MNPSPVPFSSIQTSQQQGLSLSLSFELNSQKYNAASVLGDFLKQNGGSGIRSSVPLGPFTGYASILKSSKFLKPAQQVLDDLFGTVNCEVLDFSLDCLSESEVMRENVGFSDRLEHQWKNSKLMLMLDEVYRRYKLYCQQMQSVVESFQTVAGLGNAAPYFCYAIKLVSKHFTCLKNALLDQIHFTGKTSDDGNEKVPRFWAADEQGSVQHQNPALNFSFLQHPVWRSQRGLPDHAVALLKTWLFEHFLHPYPTDSDKQILAQQTGLSRTQVSNWFINARVRLWKPMVEEVYKLASQQAQVPLEAVNHNANLPSDLSMEKLPQTSNQQKAENFHLKRSRNELADIPVQRQDHKSVSFDNLTRHYQTGISGSNGVSLALGLHQNNGTDSSRPLPITIAQHVNLEMISMMGSGSAATFQVQNQHFGKD
ncbi:bel1 homeotic protein, putative [Ricinus communis]|uniref:Bel1 homeotic protein, putative n=2 Tax=Ricinus communis TaxID=3988 RepID=B9SE26_RICCO|nr:bel1 homeotic protein, putative [Ricinus communis]